MILNITLDMQIKSGIKLSDIFVTKLRKKLSHDPTIQIINSRSQGYKIIS